MKDKIFLIGVIFFQLNNVAFGQCGGGCGPNLLPNPGFEDNTIQCQAPDNQIYSNLTPVESWFGLQAFNPNQAAGSTPDYFSPCGSIPGTFNVGCQTGDAMIGLFTRTTFAMGRESIQAQLNSPLLAGRTYCFSMTVKSRVGSVGNLISACDGIGAWFHDQGLLDININNGGQQFIGPGSLINANPQVQNPQGNMISTSCVVVTGTFCAQGGESWIVLSNFRDDASTTLTGPSNYNYMFIDEVSLYEVCEELQINLTANPQTIPCGGSTVLTPTLTSSFSNVDYLWLPVGAGLSGGGAQNVSPFSTTTYNVIASAVNACGVLVSDTASVTVDVGPCGFQVVLNDISICEGECFTLTNPIPIGGTPPYSFNWSGGVSAGDVLCLSTNSQFQLSVQDSNGDVATDILDITINPSATIDLGPDLTICSGDTILLQANANGLVSWSTNETGQTIVFSPSSTQQISAVSNLNGCVAFDTITVFVFPLPTFNVSIVNPQCFSSTNGSISLSNISGVAPFTVTWSTGQSGSATTLSNLSSGQYSFSVSDLNGCASTGAVILTSPSELSVHLSGSDSVCFGATTLVTSLVSGGTPPYTYQWSNGSQLPTTQYQVTNNMAIELVVQDANQCVGSDEIIIVPVPIPIALFEGGDSSCFSVSSTFQNLSQFASTYYWDFGNGTTGTQFEMNTTYSGGGCYDVTLIAGNSYGCYDTLTRSCVVQIYPSPQAGISANVNPVSEWSPEVTLVNSSSGYVSCLFWDGINTEISDCQNYYEVVYPSVGSYLAGIVVTNQYGCLDSAYVNIVVQASPSIYVPNAFSPNDDGTNDFFAPVCYGVEELELLIFNRWGELIYSENSLNASWDGGSKIIDVYVWKIKIKDNTGIHKTMIGHVSLVR
ncbi:MAG: gliding motility-associated C-terminal domain-containing protein [Flavobacteriales bacterium]